MLRGGLGGRSAQPQVGLQRASGAVGLEHAFRSVSLGGELRPFQRSGVRYALAQRRAFIADEHMAGILHRKRGVIDAVTDGPGEAGATALDEVVRTLRDPADGVTLRATA